MKKIDSILILFASILLMPSIVYAGERGSVTNLPLPRFVSMKVKEGYARHGPSLTHRIDWIFKYEGMPLQIIGEYNHWRRVLDFDGQGGWMHFRLLSGVRTVYIKSEKTPLHRKPKKDAMIIAFAEEGVIAGLGECSKMWCRINVGKLGGWVQKAKIWGVTMDELRK